MKCKQLLASGGMLVFVATLFVGGTGAFFSDTQTSDGNVFTAGSIDLMVNHTMQTHNDINCETCGVSIFSSPSTEIVDGTEDRDYPFYAVPAEVFEGADGFDPWVEPTGDGIWIWGQSEQPGAGDDTIYTFEETFTWNGTVGGAELDFTLAADDDFEVLLNGEEVAAGKQAWDELTTVTIDEELFRLGENTLTFVIDNSGGHNAGLLFDLTITSKNCVDGDAGFNNHCTLWEPGDIGVDGNAFFNFSEVKPADHGTNRISFDVSGNEAYMCFAGEREDMFDGGTGDLGDYITIMMWYTDGDGHPQSQIFNEPITINEFINGGVAYAEYGDAPIQPSDTEYTYLAWCFGDMTASSSGEYSCDGEVPNINSTQQAQLEATLHFYAIQSSNNEGFRCTDAEFGEPAPE